jgi:glycosyltransferase involved in cell wall biosynthesis
MNLLMILPTIAAGGHHAHYGLAVAEAGRARGWTIDLAAPVNGMNHSTGIELANVIHSTGGKRIDIEDVTPGWNGFLGYAEGQFRRWVLVRAAALRSQRLRQHDMAYVDGGDGWYLPCSLFGTPVAEVPIVTVMLRVRYHHGSLGFGAGYRVRGAFVQRLFIESFLKCRMLKAIVTPDKSWADVFSNLNGGGGKKVRYVPDMGAMITRVDRAQARMQLGINSDKRVILCLGKLDDRKGIGKLLAAVADESCPSSVAVLLMGKHDGEMSHLPGCECVAVLAKAGRIWVHEGAYTRAEQCLALSAADAVWVGYRSHPFSSGVLWEAAQAGVPVLGCDKGLIAWHIRSQDLGETVNIDDIKNITLALKRLRHDDQARARWCENGLRAGDAHTPQRFGDEIATILEEKCGLLGAEEELNSTPRSDSYHA